MSTRRTTLRRGAAVGTSAASALAAWALIPYAFGVDVTAPAMNGDDPVTIGAGAVLLASLVAGLAAWASLAVLERTVRRAGAARVWRGLALGVLLVSFGGPLGGATDPASRVALVTLHLVVAATLLVGLPRRAGAVVADQDDIEVAA